MAKKQENVPRYGTTMRRGIQYYRTRITDADGKRVDLYAETCEELQLKEMEARRQVEDAVFRRKHPTVAEYCEKWLLMQSAKVSSGTLRGYTQTMNNYIVKPLGDMYLEDVTADDIRLAMIPLASKSAGLYSKVNMLLKCVFYSAERSQLLEYNPCEGLSAKGGKPGKKINALTDEQVKLLLDTVRGLPPYTFIMIALYSGLRREEILGLQWDCVFLDVPTPYISVRRAWRSENNRPVISTTLKTKAARRDIPIPKCLTDCLREVKEKTESEYVVAGRNGNPLSSSQFQRVWKYVTVRSTKPHNYYKYVNGQCVKCTVTPTPGSHQKNNPKLMYAIDFDVWPQVALTSENYEEMLQQGLLVRAEYGEQIGMRFVEDSMFFDATNPRARKYVWEKCKKNYYDYGIRVFWLDEAEPEYGTYDFKAYRYHIGSNQQVGNVYPQYYSRTFYEGMVAAGQENPVNLVRCAWAGSQRYGALVWSGDIMSDWSYFRRQVCAGVSMGVAGIPWWTTDIGGFHAGNPENPEFRELLVRWFQWGCYCPVMRLHGDRQPAQPVYRKDGTCVLNSGSDNEVWSFGEEAYPILVKYMRRREEMRDYVRSLMKEAHETGTPLLRGMFYEFPEDAECALLQDQYMFGGKYLVAPVMELGARNRKVYLPAGTWRNVDTGEVLQGGGFVMIPAPLEVIPVLEL